MRWTVTAIYAVLTNTLEEESLEESRAKKRADPRPKIGLVATKHLGTTIPWLKAAFEEPDLLIRHEPLAEHECSLGCIAQRGRRSGDSQDGPAQWHIIPT